MSDSDTSAQRASFAVLRYGLAVSSIAAALIVTLLLHPDRLLSPVFFLAIMLSAWIGGIGAGLVAALLATMALAYFFLPPIYSLRFDPVHAPQLLVFFLSAVLVSSWMGWNVASGEILWPEETFRLFQYDRATKPTVELVLQRVHPEDAALVQQTIERASQNGKDCDSPDCGNIVNTLTEQPKTNAVGVEVNLMINVVSWDQPRGH